MRFSTWKGDGYGDLAAESNYSEIFELKQEIKQLQDRIKELEAQLTGETDDV